MLIINIVIFFLSLWRPDRKWKEREIWQMTWTGNIEIIWSASWITKLALNWRIKFLKYFLKRQEITFKKGCLHCCPISVLSFDQWESYDTITLNVPKWLLDDLGPEHLFLVQVDSAVTVPHPVWPWVWRDVFCFSCTKKSEKKEQKGERVSIYYLGTL